MKVFISADMEGICGIAVASMTETDDFDFGRARKLMTEDVNAAIRGCISAGADEIVVKDAHGTATNLLVEEIIPPAQVIQGWSAASRMMEGIDDTFDAALLVGYHARALTPDGTIAHTMTGQVARLWYNGVEIGEYGISAWHAGHFGVPMVFVSGDETLCREVKETIGEQVTALAVKSAYDRQCVRFMPLDMARSLIEQQVATALIGRDRVAPLQARGIEVKMQFYRPRHAEIACLVPTVERVDELTVSSIADGGLEAANRVSVLLKVTD